MRLQIRLGLAMSLVACSRVPPMNGRKELLVTFRWTANRESLSMFVCRRIVLETISIARGIPTRRDSLHRCRRSASLGPQWNRRCGKRIPAAREQQSPRGASRRPILSFRRRPLPKGPHADLAIASSLSPSCGRPDRPWPSSAGGRAPAPRGRVRPASQRRRDTPIVQFPGWRSPSDGPATLPAPAS